MATIAYVQSKKTVQDSALATIAASFTSNVGSDQRLLIVALGWFSSGDATLNRVSTITDSLGTSFSLAIFKAAPNSSCVAAIYYGIAPTGGANTITVTWGAAPSFQRLAITEVSGNHRTAPYDTSTATDNGTSSTTPNSGAIVPAANGELLFGWVVNNTNGVTQTAGTNEAFTLRESNSVNIGVASEDVVQTTAASTSAQFTLSAADVWNCLIVAFKPFQGLLFRGS